MTKRFAALLLAAAMLATLTAAPPNAAVFINELHYDNSAGDVAEGIEVVATAGEDLSTYRVVLYNGASPAAGLSYSDRRLAAGKRASCGNSVSITTLRSTNLIQNGSNDGIALVDGNGQVVQFISYEGSLRATDGPAAGMSASAIPLAESNSTAPGTSLQLRGSGSHAADFTWASSSPQNFDRCNIGQTFKGAAARDRPRPSIISPPPVKPADTAGARPASNTATRSRGATAPPATYWSRVNTGNAAQLRCSLHATIKGHTAYPYSGSGTSTWTILELADQDPDNPGNILDIYRNRSYPKVSARAGRGSGLTYNREHTWPKSLGFSSLTGDKGLPYAPHTDAHMLYLSDTDFNSRRGNKPLANCSKGCTSLASETSNGNGGGSARGQKNWFAGPDGSGGSFEVWDGRKGDIARGVLYMAIRYEGGTHPGTGQGEPDLELTNDRSKIVMTSRSPAYMGLLSTLLHWHRADPPNAQERRRNDVVYRFQGNRNPFIDHPEWASEALFTSSKPANCQLH